MRHSVSMRYWALATKADVTTTLQLKNIILKHRTFHSHIYRCSPFLRLVYSSVCRICTQTYQLIKVFCTYSTDSTLTLSDINIIMLKYSLSLAWNLLIHLLKYDAFTCYFTSLHIESFCRFHGHLVPICVCCIYRRWSELLHRQANTINVLFVTYLIYHIFRTLIGHPQSAYGSSPGVPLLTWNTLIPAWISDHMPSKLWDKITYPC